MTKKIIFSEEQVKEIIRLYDVELLHPLKIGNKFNCGSKVIYRILKENNINTNFSYRMKRLYDSGKIINPKGMLGKKSWNKGLKGNDFKKHYPEGIFNKKKINLDINMVKKLYLEGNSITDISKFIKCRKSSIRNRLENLKILRNKIDVCRKRMKNGGALKARMANKSNPNKPEKIIINLIQENNLSFNYVGDGKIWFTGKTTHFNPDFLSKNPRHIIEVFGNYWHNLPKMKIKDLERLETYKKYGYKTLVIWEHELKNLNEVLNKIKEFVK